MEIKATVCNFRQYGDEERKCSRCGYVIPSTNDDTKALAETIKSTGEKPLCSIKKEMTKEQIPKWVEDYYKADYKSSAGKAVKFLYEELAKEREENRHLYEQVAMLLSHSGTTNILDAIEKWREERERLSEIMGKEPVTFFLNNILRNLPSEKLPALIDALNERCSLPTKERERSEKLAEAAERLLHLHYCEQEGLSSGKPSFSDWMVATNNLQHEIDQYKQAITEYQKNK